MIFYIKTTKDFLKMLLPTYKNKYIYADISLPKTAKFSLKPK